MPADLTGRIALVTGAGVGIGCAVEVEAGAARHRRAGRRALN